MEITILSLFPESFAGPFDVSILKKAREKGFLNINLVDIRAFAFDKHRKVDDRPFGGGPGMVMKPEPLIAAIRSAKREKTHLVYLSPQGAVLNAQICERLAKEEHLVLVCGYYEGMDERIMECEPGEEISVGDYVLPSGDFAAMMVVAGLARFIPGVLGNEAGASEDSFQDGIFEGPLYTRPQEFEGRQVPSVLLNGNHAEIDRWRREKGLEKTMKRRPDLLKHKQGV